MFLLLDFYFYDQVKFQAQLSWAWKKFYNLGAWFDDLVFYTAFTIKMTGAW